MVRSFLVVVLLTPFLAACGDDPDPPVLDLEPYGGSTHAVDRPGADELTVEGDSADSGPDSVPMESPVEAPVEPDRPDGPPTQSPASIAGGIVGSLGEALRDLARMYTDGVSLDRVREGLVEVRERTSRAMLDLGRERARLTADEEAEVARLLQEQLGPELHGTFEDVSRLVDQVRTEDAKLSDQLAGFHKDMLLYADHAKFKKERPDEAKRMGVK